MDTDEPSQVQTNGRPDSGGSSTAADPTADAAADSPAVKVRRRHTIRRIIGRTLGKAWGDSIFSMSAQAAFWQALSLPPLFLALLGALGFVTGWIGPGTVQVVEQAILNFSRQVFNTDVVDQIIGPTASNILVSGRADVISVGFLIALWAGSSAVSSLVDSITEAHGQYEVRHPVIQRLFALFVYLVALVISVVTLPLLALGPDLLPRVLPESWRPAATQIIDAFYYPGIGLLIVVALTTLYKVALPRSLPWHRLVPGALLAMVVFLVSATGLRLYIAGITSTGFTYGALATPIAFLLFAFLIGFAIVLGAQLNNAIEELWPSRASRRQRRSTRKRLMSKVTDRFGGESRNGRESRPDTAPETSAPASAQLSPPAGIDS
jgi:membrane protein